MQYGFKIANGVALRPIKAQNGCIVHVDLPSYWYCVQVPNHLLQLVVLGFAPPPDKVVQPELILKTLFEYHYNDIG